MRLFNLEANMADYFKSFLLFCLFFIYNSKTYSQGYTVSSFQKINEIQGSFNGNLNIGDSFGVSVDNIGDLDGNGVNDLAVGAFQDDDGGPNRGAIYILFMAEDDSVLNYTKISSISGGFMGNLDNEDRFGGAVAYLGDLNNDGLIELAVGADYDDDGGYWHGAVWVLSLNSDGTVNSHSKISDIEGGFSGYINGDAIFGSDIENIGDLNGDGIAELAVGSRRDHDGGSRRGALWILFMNSNFTVNSEQKISSTEGNFNGNLEYEDYFGGSVANIGDLNGDGIVDLAVGSYRDDDGNTNAGSIYILFLNSDGTVGSHQKISNQQGGFAGTIANEALFGESIDGLTDIDNDGKIEIVVGAMRAVSSEGEPYGGFYILELNSDGTVSEQYFYTSGENCFNGELMPQELFAGSVTFLSEEENNIKIAVGAYRNSEGSSGQKGAVWILTLGDPFHDSYEVSHPSNCGLEDGSILFTNLNTNTTYAISYTLNGQEFQLDLISNGNGEILLSNLGAGIYSGILLLDSASGCMLSMADITLDPVGNYDPSYELNHPSNCGAEDGSIFLNDLNPGTTYTITYTMNGEEIEFDATSNVNGEILISNLASGMYSNIILLDTVSGCTIDIEDIILNSGEINDFIFELLHPSDCGVEDGSISFTNLNPNITFTITYTINGEEIEFDAVSDANGEILISGLGAGTYTNFVLGDNAVGCNLYLQNLVLYEEIAVELPELPELTSCINQNNSATFDLTIHLDSLPTEDFEIAFFLSLEDAENNENEISNPTNFQSGLNSQMIFLRYGTADCYKITDFLLNSENCELFIPQGYSPNGDGYNDVFEISGLYEYFPDFELIIFSRLGNKIYLGNNNVSEWDGTSNTGFNSSGLLPTGTYYYVLRLNDSGNQVFTGWVYLNR